MVDIVKHTFDRGQKYPYDATDAWWSADAENPPPADDWAHSAARAVLADLTDRRGIKHELEGIDEEIRAEIVQALAAVIRYSHEEAA